MKYFVLFIIVLACQLDCFAQISMTEKEIKDYFQANIYKLNPLEGLYSLKRKTNLLLIDPSSGYQNFTYKRAFLYFEESHTYIELYYDNDLKKYRGSEEFYYNYNTTSTQTLTNKETGYSYNIENSTHFFMNRDLGEGYFETNEYVKYYPTLDMYEEANIESKNKEAGNLIKNGFYSSAIAILNGALKKHENPNGYYLRAGAYYGLKNIRAAIQDCNKALSYNINTENASAVYYLRGLCHFLIEDEESGILDMKRAGEDGLKFLEENGYTSPQSAAKQKNNNAKNPTKKNQTPLLMKTK